MPSATRAFIDRIAPVFDFDLTPAPGTIDAVLAAQEWHVPLDQMLYAGDGASDLPAFDLVQRHGGLAVGVLHAGRPEEWKAARHMHAQARAQKLAPPDYAEGAPMRRLLTLAVEILGKRVALRRLALSACRS